MKAEAELGVILLEAKECQHTLEAEKGKKDFSPRELVCLC